MGDVSSVAIEVTTKDCAALGDAELSEMADLVASTSGWTVGALGKQAEEWVLVTRADSGGKLKGFLFATLERIGGTPALVIGLGSVQRGGDRAKVLKALMHEQYHKALMAFPDEDVLVSLRVTDPGGLEALSGLSDVRPFPETRANGEERAWGRRLSKRYGAGQFDDRAMIASGDSEPFGVDHEAAADVPGAAVLDDCDVDGGQFIIAWGWAMAEFLEGFG